MIFVLMYLGESTPTSSIYFKIHFFKKLGWMDRYMIKQAKQNGNSGNEMLGIWVFTVDFSQPFCSLKIFIKQYVGRKK